MKLLLDLGNTRLKWTSLDAAGAAPARAVAWDDSTALQTLAGAWRGLPEAAAVVGACVTSEARRGIVESMLADAGQPAPVWLVSPAAHGGVRNGYEVAADLGIDRFLALLAAWQAKLAPCVIAGCGSALTLDILDARGRHGGGLIGAGVVAMRRALAQAAPTLPAGNIDALVDRADNTADAVGAGAWQAAAGAIERFVREQTVCLGVPLRVVLTGGDAAVISRLLEADVVLMPDAVVRGLAAWVVAADTDR